MRLSSPTLMALALLAPVVSNAPDARADEKTPGGATETPSTWLVSASAGSGGGSIGLAGRLGLQLDYWPSEHAGIGVAAALSGQTNLNVFGSTTEGHWLVGPALSLRTSSSPGHAFVTATAGYMRGHWTDPGELSLLCAEDCDVRRAQRLALRGLGGAFGLGYLAGESPWRVGVLGLVDLMVPDHAVSLGDGTELAASVVTITLNLTVNLGLY
jgi:hypothetical protein